MKLIVIGLGNPGRKYERTRHNAGFMAADELGRRLGTEIRLEKHHALSGKGRTNACEFVIAKPQTFMNLSGRAVAALLHDTYLSPGELIVFHDELDLPPGTIRVKMGGGHGGHNGLRSIIEHLGTPDFVRIRIGIGRPAPGVDAAEYVLNPFSPEERAAAGQAVQKAVDAVLLIGSDGVAAAMNLYNQK